MMLCVAGWPLHSETELQIYNHFIFLNVKNSAETLCLLPCTLFSLSHLTHTHLTLTLSLSIYFMQIIYSFVRQLLTEI